MKTKKEIDELIKRCTSCEIEKNTNFLWYEIHESMGPCRVDDGRWYYSFNPKDLNDLYKNYILRGFIESLASKHYVGLKDFSKYSSIKLIEMVEEYMIYDGDYPFEYLKYYLNIEPTSFEEVKELIALTTRELRGLGVSCNAVIYDNYEDAFQLIYAHKEGKVFDYFDELELINDDVIN